jgi:Periplasmic binding protein
MSRIHIMALAAAASIAASAASAQESIKIGLIQSMTGAFNTAGKAAVNGASLYIQQYGDTVAGRKIQIVVKDDASTPDAAPNHCVMEGKGAYNSHATGQAAGGASAVPLLAQAAREIALDPGDQPIVIADYGSSQGKNSLAPIRRGVSLGSEAAIPPQRLCSDRRGDHRWPQRPSCETRSQSLAAEWAAQHRTMAAPVLTIA